MKSSQAWTHLIINSWIIFLTSRSAVSVHINIDLRGVMLGSDLIHVLCLCHKLSHKAIGPHKISRMQWVALKRNSVKDHISYAMLLCVCVWERERERDISATGICFMHHRWQSNAFKAIVCTPTSHLIDHLQNERDRNSNRLKKRAKHLLI